MTLSARIIRIRSDAVRVPLWSLWFPVTGVRHVLGAVVSSPRSLLAPGFWRMFAAVYVIGLDGWEG